MFSFEVKYDSTLNLNVCFCNLFEPNRSICVSIIVSKFDNERLLIIAVFVVH